MTKETAVAAAPAPEADMDRDADPIAALTELSGDDLRRVVNMHQKELAEYFRGLGLTELPGKVAEHQLNGALLHSIGAKDVDKMNFRSLGEAKGFEDFCRHMKELNRTSNRRESVIEKRMPYEGVKVHEWNERPASLCNRWSMRNYRTIPERILDFITFSPKEMHVLPEPKVVLYRDHLHIERARWNDNMPAKYKNYNRGFANPNLKCIEVDEDNVDVSLIYDVDVEAKPKVEQYTMTSVDVWRRVTCQTLKRDPLKGAFYWTNPCIDQLGFAHFYEEHPDGVVSLKVRSPGLQTMSDAPEEKKIPIVEGARELADALLNYIEEARLRQDENRSN